MKEEKLQHLTNVVYPQLHPALQSKSTRLSWAMNCSAFSFALVPPSLLFQLGRLLLLHTLVLETQGVKELHVISQNVQIGFSVGV